MPVKKLMRPGPSPTAQSLLHRLVDEWRTPDPKVSQPIIVEESGGQLQPTHIYVIWDDWTPLGSIERSEVITDAYEEIHGPASTNNVTVAMGLTPAEADHLGIRYR